MTKIDQLRNIVSSHSFGEVEGVEIDVQTANAIVTIYDNLGDQNKVKYINSSIDKMADIAWKLLSK
jgi:hypothetical protein